MNNFEQMIAEFMRQKYGALLEGKWNELSNRGMPQPMMVALFVTKDRRFRVTYLAMKRLHVNVSELLEKGTLENGVITPPPPFQRR